MVVRGVVRVILAPFKLIGKILKVFRPFIRHPRLGLGLLAGVACLIEWIKYGHRLTGAAGVIARVINQVTKGLIYTGSLLI